EDRVAFGDERGQEAIAGRQPLADQRLGDGLRLVAMVEIADDAEQVSRVDTVGERAGGALAGEDRDGIDDGVSRVAGDGVEKVVAARCATEVASASGSRVSSSIGGTFWANKPKQPSTWALFWGRSGVARIRSVSSSAASTSGVWFEGRLSSSKASGVPPVVA